jgi:uncharacterized phage protein gp47/JayE
MIGDILKNYTWTNVMNMCLEQVADDVDKRQGSIIYDTLSPAVTALMVIVEQMRLVYINTFIGTASGEYLDKRVAELGLTRIEATYAKKKVYIYDTDGNLTDLYIGTIIKPKSNSNNETYVLSEKVDTGIYKVECTEAGTSGNTYLGECVGVTNLTNIGTISMTELLESARNEETDEELRLRAYEATQAGTFGGNIQDYRALVGVELTTVGAMQVYPRSYKEGVLDSIVVSVIDNDKLPMTAEQLNSVSEQLDPSEYPGEGRGILPLGHHPKLMTPTQVAINMSMTVTPKAGYTVDGLKSSIETALKSYINDLIDAWANIDYSSDELYTCIVYEAQILASVMAVEGVLNVENITINGSASDYKLTETKELQEIPVVGTITIN